MNLEIAILEQLINDLKYEVDRLKHELKLANINIESHGRRLDMQIKMNDLFAQDIKVLNDNF